MSDISKCPAMGGPQQHLAASTSANQRWWPELIGPPALVGAGTGSDVLLRSAHGWALADVTH